MYVLFALKKGLESTKYVCGQQSIVCMINHKIEVTFNNISGLWLLKNFGVVHNKSWVWLGGSDKMQNFDFGPTHETGGAKHKINDFCFSFQWNLTPPKPKKWFLADFSNVVSV